MDLILEILSLGPFSVSALIIFIVYIYYMIADDEEEENEQDQENTDDFEETKNSLLTEIKHLRLEEELGVLTEKNKARLNEIVMKYKQLSDSEELI